MVQHSAPPQDNSLWWPTNDPFEDLEIYAIFCEALDPPSFNLTPHARSYIPNLIKLTFYERQSKP